MAGFSFNRISDHCHHGEILFAYWTLNGFDHETAFISVSSDREPIACHCIVVDSQSVYKLATYSMLVDGALWFWSFLFSVLDFQMFKSKVIIEVIARLQRTRR